MQMTLPRAARAARIRAQLQRRATTIIAVPFAGSHIILSEVKPEAASAIDFQNEMPPSGTQLRRSFCRNRPVSSGTDFLFFI
jgi:hypothetical protein